ncbi:MAG TPA: 3-methyl-2-oxobutanoate hydroxymethyltransferase [Phycisphaerae bacterium]|nr:3-methyl-2-oxobutanoate hydroxymethyltransferase [Phycisphaerae bacterium]
MTTPASAQERIDLARLRNMKAAGRKIVMLTAYDYPTAALAQAAGVHMLLIGDSLATVILGRPNTRSAPLELMLVLGEAVRRGAPNVYLVGDMPYESLSGGVEVAVTAARRYCEVAGCDAVKLETRSGDERLVTAISAAGIPAIAHLGLRPQDVLSPDGYRAQARDADSITALVADARRMVAAGAIMVLLEAVSADAAQAVVAAVDVPVIGCGAGPACHGHVVVTQDLVGLSTIRPPRFVPVLAQLGPTMLAAMRRFVEDIDRGTYPGPEHVYGLRGGGGERTP